MSSSKLMGRAFRTMRYRSATEAITDDDADDDVDDEEDEFPTPAADVADAVEAVCAARPVTAPGGTGINPSQPAAEWVERVDHCS